MIGTPDPSSHRDARARPGKSYRDARMAERAVEQAFLAQFAHMARPMAVRYTYPAAPGRPGTIARRRWKRARRVRG